MKNYIILLFTTLAFVSCKKLTGVDLSGAYVIKSGENLSIPQNRNLVSITASDFVDSRCPTNATCVWQGTGTGKFTFKDKNKEQTIALCIGGCEVVSKPKTQNITLNSLNYSVELSELSPYPTMEPASQATKATIVLKRK